MSGWRKWPEILMKMEGNCRHRCANNICMHLYSIQLCILQCDLRLMTRTAIATAIVGFVQTRLERDWIRPTAVYICDWMNVSGYCSCSVAVSVRCHCHATILHSCMHACRTYKTISRANELCIVLPVIRHCSDHIFFTTVRSSSMIHYYHYRHYCWSGAVSSGTVVIGLHVHRNQFARAAIDRWYTQTVCLVVSTARSLPDGLIWFSIFQQFLCRPTPATARTDIA